MNALLLGARLLLAGVLGVAGVAKLIDRAGSQQAFINFGVPPALASLLGRLLPLVELTVAVALIPTATAWWGAVGTFVLLLLFSIGIGMNLARGRRPDCHCFGQLAVRPISGMTLTRNIFLVAVAGFILWQGKEDSGASVLAWLGGLTPAEYLALLNGVLALGLGAAVLWLLLQLLGQQGRLLIRLDGLETQLAAGGLAPRPATPASQPGLPLGAPAPAFRLEGLHGEMMTLDALRGVGTPVLLLFINPTCGPCHALLPDISRWQREHAAHLTLALISRGSVEANRLKTAEHGLRYILLQQDHEVAKAYQAYGTPSAVVVRVDGTIGSALAQGAEHIRALVVQTLGTPQRLLPLAAVPASPNGSCPHCGKPHTNGAVTPPNRPSGFTLGTPAPAFQLLDLTGRIVELADFRGRETLVLFWNPSCGFCQQMLADLRAWEAHPRPGTPQLLVVSTGTVAANAALGLRAPVVVDESFRTAAAFGARGTPSGVLVDTDGTIASPVAVGAEAILALARGVHARSADALV